MSGVDEHNHHQDSAGAYVLGALDDHEVAPFERHVAGCAVCSDEVERLRAAVQALPRSVSQVVAPPRLKAGLMKTIDAEVRAERGRPKLGAALRARFAGWSNGLAMRPGVALVSASCLLFVGILAGYGATQMTQSDTRTLSAQVDRDRIPLATASLVVPDDGGEGAVLRVHGMPQLDSNAVYQVWTQRDGETVSQSLFGVGADGNGAAAVADDLEDVDAVMVTREPRGGASAPSEKPVLSIAL